MTPEEADRFTTLGQWRQIGPLLIGHVTAGDFRLVRTKAMAKRIGLDHVFINVFLAGRGEGVCGRRRMRFAPGAMSITKLSSPADYRLEGITLTAIVVARRLLEAAIGPVAALDGRVYPAESVEARLVDAHITALLALPDPLGPAQASIASRSTLMMLAACLNGGPVHEGAKLATPADLEVELAKAIRRFIKQRLADPGLGSELICSQFALSRARLYRLMRDGGTIATTIRRLRLTRAYAEIAMGRYAGFTAAEVANQSGFRQERSFRRAFIQQFAITPAALQARARAAPMTPLPATGPVIADWFNEL
nr:helix-turn-helix domain-containing protein [Bosea sp. AAP35]